MEVYFLDVGQGTCQIILLGNRRAIVVDCGVKVDELALRFLKRYGVETLEALIVSHSHEDHVGGAISILDEYQDRIEKLCFVQDDMFLKSRFWERVKEFILQGVLSQDQLFRLECNSQPQEIWSDGNASLATYSPTTGINLLAQSAGVQNATSAVLFFDVGNNRIVFAADSEIQQWRDIHARAGTISCNVLAVPHHAGKLHQSSSDLQWLFGQAIQPQVAVVSVGTSNNHNHPREDVIRALRACGASVLCTQITQQCCSNLEALRPAVLSPLTILGRSSATADLTKSGNSRNVACAGTVVATIDAQHVEIDRIAQHQAAVDRLASNAHGSPLCR